VGLGLVIERAVRFDVSERGTLGSCDGLESAKLVEDQVNNFIGSQVHRAPAESLPVIEAGMRADGDPVAKRQGDGGTHGGRVSRVKSACDVRGGDQRQQRRFYGRLALADIGIEVDRSHANFASRSPARMRLPGLPRKPFPPRIWSSGEPVSRQWCTGPRRPKALAEGGPGAVPPC